MISQVLQRWSAYRFEFADAWLALVALLATAVFFYLGRRFMLALMTLRGR